MLLQIFKFEIQYRARRVDTYLYFAILFLFSLVSVRFFFGENLDPLKENAPYVIAYTMTVLSAIFMMITSMIMGVAALRDFDHHMESIMFVNPIKKRDYLLGRFLGSYVVLVFINSGLLLGIILGEYLPWRDTNDLLAFELSYYLQPFVFLVLPTLFFGGAIFFVSGALSRKMLVVYTQGILFFIGYIFATVLTRNSEGNFLAAILDPFGYYTVKIVAELWTAAERNAQMLPLDGVLLYNRLVWVLLGVITLIIGHYCFSFNVVRGRISKNPTAKAPENHIAPTRSALAAIPAVTLGFDFKANAIKLVHHSWFFFISILKEAPFWAIVICGMSIIFVNSISLGTYYGVDSYPTTYLIIEELLELSIFFFLIILVFYSGELIWKERDTRLNLIFDALPSNDFILLAGKFIGLHLTYIVLIIALTFSGVMFQALNGYEKHDLEVYFISFFLELLPFLMLYTFVAFFFQVFTNHKYLGHILTVIFFIGTIMMEGLGFDHGLYRFGGTDLSAYSDMNGFGHSVEAYIWFKVYWIAFTIFLFAGTVIFSVRGTETGLKHRWKMARQRLTKPMIRLGASALIIFTLAGCYIFFNTNILNKYASKARQEVFKVNYEKNLKKFEHIPQPKIVSVNLKVDLFPSTRDYTVEGCFILENKHDEAISEIHIQSAPSYQISMVYLEFEGGSRLNDAYEQFYHDIHILTRPLQPGDSIKMKFKQTFTTPGFVERSSNRIVENGTFFDNFRFPTLGYNRHIELKEDGSREDYGLEPKLRSADRGDVKARREGLAGDDGEEINFEIVLSTETGQTAVAPGYLLKEWIEEERSYFHYKMDKPMSNFYSIVSARYSVMKDQWNPVNDSLSLPVDLEIYYHKGHEYNLNRMMNGMKKSFDYFSEHFGPYQYRQMRILEFPRYVQKAQSFPNTVPFSEASGFILDIDDEHDVDLAFYITAHEIAHQWWGHQVNPANVQGRSMISEALAQYSALMVLKQEYPTEKVQKFLQTQMDRYLKGRTSEKVLEMPLSLVESGQDYIHYGKGLVALNILQDYISEDSVNIALKRFVKDWSSYNGLVQKDRYATTQDLLAYFHEVTPDTLSYLIGDLFEDVLLYDYKTSKATASRNSDGTYMVHLELEVAKYRSDDLGQENEVAIADYVDIGIYADSEKGRDRLIYLKKHLLDENTKTLDIKVNQKPLSAGVDPLHNWMDKNPVDNVRGIEFSDILIENNN